MPPPVAQSKTTWRTPLLASLLFTGIATIATAATANAQTVNWSQIGYASAPSPRADAAIAYDGATHSTVLFGGINGGSAYGDTWIWNGVWRPALPDTSPSPRQGPAMAYDRAAGNMVLFGGSAFPFTAGTAFGDTWIWDGAAWTQLFPPVSPSPRLWSTMVYDPAIKRVLLFGGSNTPGGDDAFSDTWAWDGLTKTWSELHPRSHPSGRAANQLVYDRATSTVVLFGGVTTNLIHSTILGPGTDMTGRNTFPRPLPPLAMDLESPMTPPSARSCYLAERSELVVPLV